VHDTTAYAKCRMITLCVLSFGFKNAFDRIALYYIFNHSRDTALANPLSPASSGYMKVLHRQSNQWAPIRTHTNSLRSASGVSNECGPLYLCLQLYLRLPELNYHLYYRTPYTATMVVAYADDVNIFVTSAADFVITQEAVHLMNRHQRPD